MKKNKTSVLSWETFQAMAAKLREQNVSKPWVLKVNVAAWAKQWGLSMEETSAIISDFFESSMPDKGEENG